MNTNNNCTAHFSPFRNRALSSFNEKSGHSGRQWTVDPGACSTVALWSLRKGQHGQSQGLCAVQCATCWASKTNPPAQPSSSSSLPSPPVKATPGMQTRQQLSQVTSRLTAMESDVSMESLSDGKPAQEDRSVLSAHIKTLESTLATLPITPQFAEHRVALEEEILLAKKRIMLLKPVGARIDECRQALGRAVKRQLEAQETLRLAAVTLEKANTEGTTLAEDLSQLEAAVASEPISQSPENSLQQLRSGMEAVPTDMESAGSLAGDLVSGAGLCVQQLFTQLSSVAETLKMVSPAPRLVISPRRTARFDPFSHETQSRLRGQCLFTKAVQMWRTRDHSRTESLGCHRQCLHIAARATQAGSGSINSRWRFPPEPLNWMRSSRPQVCTSLLFKSVESKVTGSCVVLTTPCTKPVPTPTGSTARRHGFPTISRNLSRNLFPSTHAYCTSRCASTAEPCTSSLLTRPLSVLTLWTRMPFGLSLICICLVCGTSHICTDANATVG